jgi:transposase
MVYKEKEMVSLEIRESISRAKKEGMRVSMMEKVFRVPERTIYGLLARERKTGSMEPSIKRGGRPSSIDSAGLEAIKKLVEERPDITLEEIKGTMNLSICISALCRILHKKLGFNYKKKPACQRAG